MWGGTGAGTYAVAAAVARRLIRERGGDCDRAERDRERDREGEREQERERERERERCVAEGGDCERDLPRLEERISEFERFGEPPCGIRMIG